MKKYSKIISVALSVGIVTGIINQAMANTPYEKNKMPCLEEICIGDDLKSLQNVPWMSVDKLLDAKQYKGWKIVGDIKALQKLLPYLSAKLIDKKGINLLPQIKGFCARPFTNPIFTGVYKGKDGRPIDITFALVTSADYKSQKIIVSDITKQISTTNLSSSQIKSLNAEMDRRYPNSNQALSQTSAFVQASFSKDGGVTSRLFHKTGFKDWDGGAALLEFPGCTKKVEL